MLSSLDKVFTLCDLSGSSKYSRCSCIPLDTARVLSGLPSAHLCISVLAACASLQHLTTSFCPEALLCFYCYKVSHRLASMGVRSAAACLGEHTISPTQSTMVCPEVRFPHCGAVSTRGITILVPELFELYRYEMISDPGMGP